MIKLRENFVQIIFYLPLTIGLILTFDKLTFAQNYEDESKEICESNLAQEIEAIIKQPETAKATWGIVVKKINSSDNIYQLNSDKLLIPASNAKLFTTAGILLKLGADFQIKTPVYLQQKIEKEFNLIIIGKGDPSLDSNKLELLAQKLKEKGINRINQLTIIDGYLAETKINDSWEYSDIYYYYAVPVNSLILNENAVTLTLKPSQINQPVTINWDDQIASRQWIIKNYTLTGDEKTEYNIKITPIFTTSILHLTGELAISAEVDKWRLAIPQPEQYFLDSLREILNNYGIAINKTEIIADYDSDDNQLTNNLFFEFESPKLRELIKITNQESNNLFAEVLFKYLANQPLDSFTSLQEILTDLGIDKNSYQLKDGSGLSRHNLVTPSTLVELLQSISQTKYGDIFLDSLAISGKNGTLKNRFLNSIVTENLYGKTGTLSGASILSGYLKRENQTTLVFSIIVNNSTQKSSYLRNVIDKLILLIAESKSCFYQ